MHSITEIRKKFHISGEVIDKCVKIIEKKGQKLRTYCHVIRTKPLLKLVLYLRYSYGNNILDVLRSTLPLGIKPVDPSFSGRSGCSHRPSWQAFCLACKGRVFIEKEYGDAKEGGGGEGKDTEQYFFPWANWKRVQ
jgi:hypothetical protein